jgi:hypothetical protein
MADLGRRCLTAVLIAGLAACAEPSATADQSVSDGDEAVSNDPSPGADALPEAIFSSVRDDLVVRSGAAPGEVRVVSAQAMRWNDGSMGCPQPGQSYMQALVDGYRVVLEARGRSYDYRTNLRGAFVLCEQPGPNPGGQPREVR